VIFALAKLGEFDDLNQAINSCKKVVDDFLNSRGNVAESADQLVFDFLYHGDVPTISGAENLRSFDVYEYLAERSSQIHNLEGSN
jgi:hypothetical protein